MSSWMNVAIELGKRMRNHAYCEAHPDPEHPDPACPFCDDRAAYLLFIKKVRESMSNKKS